MTMQAVEILERVEAQPLEEPTTTAISPAVSVPETRLSAQVLRYAQPLTREQLQQRLDIVKFVQSQLSGVEPLDIRGNKYFGWQQVGHLFPLIFRHHQIITSFFTVKETIYVQAELTGLTVAGDVIQVTTIVSELDPIVQETKRRAGDFLKVMSAKAQTQVCLRALRTALGLNLPILEEYTGTGADPELETRHRLVEEIRNVLPQLGWTEQRYLKWLSSKLGMNFKDLHAVPTEVLKNQLQALQRQLQKTIQKAQQVVTDELIDAIAQESQEGASDDERAGAR